MQNVYHLRSILFFFQHLEVLGSKPGQHVSIMEGEENEAPNWSPGKVSGPGEKRDSTLRENNQRRPLQTRRERHVLREPDLPPSAFFQLE